MARKTRKISLKERISSWRDNREARRKRIAAIWNWNWVAIVKVVATLCFLAGSGAFLRYAEGYVKSVAPIEEGSLILVEVPGWANWDLKNRVAEVAGGTRFPLTEETASVLARNLSVMSWLHDVHVQVTHDSVRVKAQWRKPVVMIDIPETSSKIYVDEKLVVMDYMPMPHLPIVEAKGVSLNIVPPIGQVFDEGDVAAAVTLAVLLNRVDVALLEQIASIDVTNYRGRDKAGNPHITMRSKNDTDIIWGAEFGEYTTHLEASDDEKVAKLYTYFKEHGSLGGGAKYIDLLSPQDRVPKPIDKRR